MGRTTFPSIEGHASGTRTPIAADLKRAMREKSRTGQTTFALHRCLGGTQTGTDRGTRFVPPGVPSPTRLCRLREQCWNIRSRSSEPLLVLGCVRHRTSCSTIPGESCCAHVAHARRGRLPSGRERTVLQRSIGCVLPVVLLLHVASILEQDCGRRHGHLGWLRAASPQQPTWDLSEARRAADQMGERGRELDVHLDEQIRGRAWQDRKRGSCPGVGKGRSLAHCTSSSRSILGARFVVYLLILTPSRAEQALPLCVRVGLV